MNREALALEDQGPLVAFLETRLREPHLEPVLLGPLREFLSRPGKQLRARLVEVAFEAAGGRGAPPEELCLGLELLHAGSLIVDDIEDCAEERRGGPPLHLTAGLPVALNAGNWLYFAGLEAFGEIPLGAAQASLVLRRAHAFLARCHEGQALDVGVRIEDVPQQEVAALVRSISEGKTGALAALGASLAAICAGASPGTQAAFAAFGSALGVGLQMLDDLGAIASGRRRDKGEEDIRNGRATWAWAALAERLEPAAYRRLLRDPDLLKMRRLLGARWNEPARRQLEGALAILRDAGSASRALTKAAALIAAIGRSYG